MKDRLWRCRDGRVLKISDMTDSHIRNCIQMIQRSGFRWRVRYLDRLEIELIIRSMGARLR